MRDCMCVCVCVRVIFVRVACCVCNERSHRSFGACLLCDVCVVAIYVSNGCVYFCFICVNVCRGCTICCYACINVFVCMYGVYVLRAVYIIAIEYVGHVACVMCMVRIFRVGQIQFMHVTLCMSVCTYACVHVRDVMRACVLVFMCIGVFVFRLVGMRLCLYVFVFVHVCMYIYIYIYVCVLLFVCMCVSTLVGLYVWAFSFIHICMYLRIIYDACRKHTYKLFTDL